MFINDFAVYRNIRNIIHPYLYVLRNILYVFALWFLLVYLTELWMINSPGLSNLRHGPVHSCSPPRWVMFQLLGYHATTMTCLYHTMLLAMIVIVHFKLPEYGPLLTIIYEYSSMSNRQLAIY